MASRPVFAKPSSQFPEPSNGAWVFYDLPPTCGTNNEDMKLHFSHYFIFRAAAIHPTTLLSALFLLFSAMLMAQPTGGMPGGGNFDPSAMNIGRFYGKVIDESGRGLGYATVQLFGQKFDPQTRSFSETLLAGQLTEENGDFNLEKLPIVGDFTLKISFLGYADITQTVTFGIKPPPMPAGGPMRPDSTGKAPAGPSGGFAPPAGGFPGGGFPGAAAGQKFEKDLGNISVVQSGVTLQEVTVTETATVAKLALDRKTYRVDKDMSAVGGTAQDALKNVPSLSVDLDGNVSLRNGAPQIFVDGRPTTLSLDQISADAIESVEVITNPSARFDAGGGTAGIINIVLKKERRLGYNGNVRLGADSRGGYNFGGDLNARGESINLFGALNANHNANFGEGETVRSNYFGDPFSNLRQETYTDINGLFLNGRAGLDWLIDNRNTLTVSGNYTRGKFQPTDEITTETEFLYPSGALLERYVRTSDQDRNFRNMGASLQFKHLFSKPGYEWTADLNYNKVRFEGGSRYNTLYDNNAQTLEKQDALGRGQFVTFQTDFINPLNENTKLEYGLRAALRTNRNDNMNFVFSAADNDWKQVAQLSDHYKFDDNVFAAYLQGSRQFGAWGVQAGLRAESSFYTGALTDRDSSFTIQYPLSLFPSVFVTRQLNKDGDQMQLAYTRRVNRPNFFQTMPFTDFSDSLNLRRGNPQLLPEFTNALELTYQNVFSKGSLLVSAYFKQANNLITTYQFGEYDAATGRQLVITSYVNADYASAYGLEVTLRNSLAKWFELTTNVNLYQAVVEAGNVESNLNANRLSLFIKETAQFRLPKNFSFQLNGEYRSRAAFVPSNNNDPFRGGPGGGSQNTAQGYTLANWFVDVSVQKQLLQGKGRLSLSVQDVFASRKFGSYSYNDFFEQETYRIMGPQTVRLNFMYMFGKMDTSLFARKNTRAGMQGNDMMQ